MVDLGPILLVCTHGVHDTCCALRGRPVAAALAARWPDQVWECSHVGGDRFAPNVVVLPDGFYYGNLDPETAVGAIRRHLGGEVVVEHLRGMARFAPPVQAAAAAVFDRCGPLGADDVRVRSVRQIGPHLGHGSETFVELELADGRSARVDVLSVRRPEARAHLPGGPGDAGHRVPGGDLRGPSRRLIRTGSGYGPQASVRAVDAFLPSWPIRTRLARASRITRAEISEVCSAQSYGGEHSTTSIPEMPPSATRRTRPSASRGSRPPGSGQPVPGTKPESITSMSKDR